MSEKDAEIQTTTSDAEQSFRETSHDNDTKSKPEEQSTNQGQEKTDEELRK